jgi:hypothetical protein
MVGANVDAKTIADCPLEELQSRVRPVLKCWAEGCRRLKGGGFSRLIDAGRAGYRRDVMESGVSVTSCHEHILIFRFMCVDHAARYCKSAGNNPERSGTQGMEKILAKMEKV